MMRGTVSLILISLVAIQPVPVVAQEPAPNPRLQAIIRHIPREVERFSKLEPPPVVAAQEGQSAPVAADPNKAEQIRARLLETPLGTELHVTLRDGQVLHGQLAALADTYFRLRTTAPEETRAIPGQESAMIDKQYSFDEVRVLFIGADPRDLLVVGKGVEVSLLGGDNVKGHVTSVSDHEFTLDTRRITLEEVASVRSLGMRRRYKVLIIAAVVSTLVILGVTRAFCEGNQC